MLLPHYLFDVFTFCKYRAAAFVGNNLFILQWVISVACGVLLIISLDPYIWCVESYVLPCPDQQFTRHQFHVPKGHFLPICSSSIHVIDRIFLANCVDLLSFFDKIFSSIPASNVCIFCGTLTDVMSPLPKELIFLIAHNIDVRYYMLYAWRILIFTEAFIVFFLCFFFFQLAVCYIAWIYFCLLLLLFLNLKHTSAVLLFMCCRKRLRFLFFFSFPSWYTHVAQSLLCPCLYCFVYFKFLLLSNMMALNCVSDVEVSFFLCQEVPAGWVSLRGVHTEQMDTQGADFWSTVGFYLVSLNKFPSLL